MFIAIAMTGLDQEMMQKNISCRNLKEAQRNMLTFTGILVIVNLIFLALGALLYLFAEQQQIQLPSRSDELFPAIALNYLGGISAVFFVIGIISAAYPSADGALTALTTSFCFDMLGLNKKENWSDARKKRVRYIVHFSFALILLIVIVIFRIINDEAVILKLFTVAGYTYGPLLGLYAFGLFYKDKIRDHMVPLICLLSVFITYLLDHNSETLFSGYKFGFELIILNGLVTFLGLNLLRKPNEI
jgi:Na+/proline symporter